MAQDGFPRRIDYPQGEPHNGVEEMLGSPEPNFSHYVWGSSFVSWLWETHGQSTLLGFVNDPSFSDDEMLPLSFEDHFGQTLAEADQAWAIDERPDPTGGAPCIPDRTYSLADGPVAISFEAEHGELQVLGREPCDAGPAGAEAYRDKWVKAGNMLEEDIAGCRYRMLVSSQEPGFPATPYTIRIEEIAR